MPERPLLMIPGPIEVSHGVLKAAATAPPSHVAPDFIRSFGRCLALMRDVWLAPRDGQPFIVAGSGTLAMEMAVTNLLDCGDRAVVVSTGYFSERMAEMLRRRGVAVTEVRAAVGDVPGIAEVAAALEQARPVAMFATHVDTSTGVRVDAPALARLAAEHGCLSIFDGVCATVAERFEMEAWGADLYLTGSQKAIGLPPGLALLVASRRALERRMQLKTAPPLSLDWQQWLPVMEAYEAGTPSYFATPATSLVCALEVGLEEILADGANREAAMAATFARHARAADAMRDAWKSFGLQLVPFRDELAANSLSALRLPAGVGPELVPAIAKAGVIVAGGLHPEIKTTSFRIGHMGEVTRHPDLLARTVAAVGTALRSFGHDVDAEVSAAAVAAATA